MLMMRTPLLLLAALLASPAGADIYKVVTDDGRVIYTDDPPEEEEEAEVETMDDLPPIIIEPSLDVPDDLAAGGDAEAGESAAEQGQDVPAEQLPSLEIASPTEEQAIPPGQRQVPVNVRLDKPLPDGYRLQLKHNGSAHGEPSQQPRWVLEHLNPGEQKLQVELLDAQGQVVESSSQRTFFVIR